MKYNHVVFLIGFALLAGCLLFGCSSAPKGSERPTLRSPEPPDLYDLVPPSATHVVAFMVGPGEWSMIAVALHYVVDDDLFCWDVRAPVPSMRKFYRTEASLLYRTRNAAAVAAYTTIATRLDRAADAGGVYDNYPDDLAWVGLGEGRSVPICLLELYYFLYDIERIGLFAEGDGFDLRQFVLERNGELDEVRENVKDTMSTRFDQVERFAALNEPSKQAALLLLFDRLAEHDAKIDALDLPDTPDE